MASKKADQKQKQKANRTALKAYPKAELRQAFDQLADIHGAVTSGSEARQSAAATICILAESFRNHPDVKKVDYDTRIQDWRENSRLLAQEMANSNHPFAESVENKAGVSYRLTGYGNNVMSIAKGVVQYDDIEIAEDATYTEIRDAVQERRRADRPNAAIELANAKETLDDAVKAAREACGDDAGLFLLLADVVQTWTTELLEADKLEIADDETEVAEAA